jgi:dTDP-4-dehydrorhamnose reductase
MMRLMNERPEIKVVNDQIGAPTYAADLAKACLDIIAADKWQAGIYHYSNSGKISWYDFAVAIQEMIGSSCIVHPIPTTDYPTPAKRPKFSLLDTTKIKEVFSVNIPEWRESLGRCVRRILMN